jgi:hypothetical protein
MPITAKAIILNMASDVARFNESRADHLLESLSSQTRRPPHSDHAKQDGKPAKYEHYLIPMRSQLTATRTLNSG